MDFLRGYSRALSLDTGRCLSFVIADETTGFAYYYLGR